MPQSWIGIRVSAALAILGSLLTLLFAALLVWTAVYSAPASGEPMPLRPVMAVLAVFFVGLTVWGMATGVGILKRRAWARISIVIFAVFLAGMGGSALLAIVFVRMPASPQLSARAAVNIRLLMASFYAGLALIGAWWLLLFNSQRAKQYFSGAPEPGGAGRPLGVRIIGWYVLIGALCTAFSATLRVPALFFGVVVTGWAALGIYTAYTAVQIYLGTGLLQFHRGARAGSIGFFAFVAANNVISMALPGYPDRMRAMLEAMPRFMHPAQAEMPYTMGPFVIASTLLLVLVPIWLLARRKEAFQ